MSIHPRKLDKRKRLAGVLSSPPRIAIVLELKDGPKKFSEIKERLRMTDGDLNYHLSRLSIWDLVGHDPDDKWSLTNEGTGFLELAKKVLEMTETR